MAVWNRENFLNSNPWQSAGSGARPGAPINTALAQALAGIVKPEIGSSFQAPALRINPLQARNDPHPEQRGPIGNGMPTQLDTRGGGGRDLGGAAKAAGLQKLGQGIEQGLGDIAAKRAAAAAAAAGPGVKPPDPYGAPAGSKPPRPFGAPISGDAGDVGDKSASPPYAPSPVGAASNTPIWAQPGTGTGPVGSSIDGGGSLPTFAQGGGSGASTGRGLFNQLVSAYQKLGYSPTQAVNIASVQIRGEGSSLGSGGADSSAGGSNGISQWSADRWNNLLKWTAANGLDPRSVAGQAGFTDHELRTSYANADPNSVSSLVNNYESPRSDLRAGEIARAQQFAKDNYGSAGSGAPPPMSPSAAYAATPPTTENAPTSPAQPPTRSLFGEPPAGSSQPDTAPSIPPAGPAQISPGKPQTGPAYSDDTWNNRPQFNYGGGQQGMNDVPLPQQPTMNPLALALAGQGDANAAPAMTPEMVALLNGDPFGFGGYGA